MKKYFAKVKDFFRTSDWSPFVIMGLILLTAIVLGIVLNNTVELK